MNILDHEIILEFFRTNYEIFLLSLVISTFTLTYYLIPKVLWVSKEKRLTAPVVGRSSHSVEVPSFGGVAFFITLVLVISLIQSMRLSYVGNHLIAAITVLFMVGLKDDLVVSSAKVKLLGQLTATCFIIFSPEMHLANLQGFWGINEIPETLGFIFIGFLVIALINAYNLIDGIDGLASIVGIVISICYAILFYIFKQPFYAIVSLSLTGILAAFLRYNFSRGSKKIFMGDSGSLVVGLILAFLSIKILVMEPAGTVFNGIDIPANRLLFLSCALFIPVFDTLRVIIIRSFNKVSPFTPDRNHIHHVLLDLGFSHKKASACLAVLNIFMIVVYLSFADTLSNLWLSLFVVCLYAGAYFLFFKLKRRTEKVVRSTHIGIKEKENNYSKAEASLES